VRLLNVSSVEGFEPYFGEVVETDLRQLAPQVTSSGTGVMAGDIDVAGFDAAYIEIPLGSAVFGRVLFESLQDINVSTNHSSAGFFAAAKKNYMFYVLRDADVSAPSTVVASNARSARGLDKHLDFPVVARRLRGTKPVEMTALQSPDEVEGFAEGADEDSVLLFSGLEKGDKYRFLVAGDTVVSLTDTSNGWRFDDTCLKYSNPGSDIEELARSAVRAIGTSVADVSVRAGEVVDIDPNPDIDLYSDAANRDAFEAVSEAVK